jgi:signal transduction histidine kinase
MPIRLRTRLSLSFLSILLLGAGLVGVSTWFTVERLYVETQRENLLALARLTAESLRGADIATLADETYSQTTNVQPGIHTHLLQQSQAVILDFPLGADSPSQQVPPAENSSSVSSADLLQRPEVRSALSGNPATSIRRVTSAENRRVLYAAVPVYSLEGRISGIVYLAAPLPAGGLPASIIIQLAGVLALITLLALVAAFGLSRRIAQPIEAIARAADRVAAGDLDQQVPPARSDWEVARLSRSFNEMAQSLRQTDQAKTTFIADVTHELRTPLTVIKGTIETLEDGALDDAEGRGPLLASMQRETERLIRLVNDLLVLTRADAGALKLNLQSIDLADLAHSRCQTLAPLALGRSVTLQVRGVGLTTVQADPDRLAQILDNLIDNAIRHSPAGSTVTILLETIGSELQCAVKDTGSGIPPEHLPFIFERFYRAEPARDRQTGGNGLGLAIVRAFVLAHGGRVNAESTLGKGTTITFWLPLAT